MPEIGPSFRRFPSQPSPRSGASGRTIASWRFDGAGEARQALTVVASTEPIGTLSARQRMTRALTQSATARPRQSRPREIRTERQPDLLWWKTEKRVNGAVTVLSPLDTPFIDPPHQFQDSGSRSQPCDACIGRKEKRKSHADRGSGGCYAEPRTTQERSRSSRISSMTW